MSDMSNKMSGKAKEMTGKVTDNKRLELKGKAQSKAADLSHKAKDTMDDISHKIHHDD